MILNTTKFDSLDLALDAQEALSNFDWHVFSFITLTSDNKFELHQIANCTSDEPSSKKQKVVLFYKGSLN